MSIATRDIPIGYELTSISKIAKMKDYSDTPGSIHNEEMAKRMGFEAALIPGAIMLGYMTELLVNFFGERWIRQGKIGVKFTAPVRAGERITARGIVRERVEEGMMRLGVEVWCENQQGEKVAVGTAVCSVA